MQPDALHVSIHPLCLALPHHDGPAAAQAQRGEPRPAVVVAGEEDGGRGGAVGVARGLQQRVDGGPLPVLGRLAGEATLPRSTSRW